MKRIMFQRALFIALFLFSGCHFGQRMAIVVTPSEVLPEERAAMQTRVFMASDDIVFSAMVATLQDLGWSLDAADRASGIIRASTGKRLEPLGPKEEAITSFEWRRATIEKRGSEKDQWTRWDEMVAHIEKWPNSRARARIVLSRRGSLPAMSYPSKVDRREVIINAPAKEESVEVSLDEVYATLFKKIEQAVQERMGGGLK
ncbi:MAG: hypothetical protein M5U15_06540 [Kiritimatiellae bacterium]|nr:hypothetical protein [Kiritimatiellia bacterium]